MSKEDRKFKHQMNIVDIFKESSIELLMDYQKLRKLEKCFDYYSKKHEAKLDTIGSFTARVMLEKIVLYQYFILCEHIPRFLENLKNGNFPKAENVNEFVEGIELFLKENEDIIKILKGERDNVIAHRSKKETQEKNKMTLPQVLKVNEITDSSVKKLYSYNDKTMQYLVDCKK